ncbi:MAG: DUF2585 family protein [Bauldia sp.]
MNATLARLAPRPVVLTIAGAALIVVAALLNRGMGHPWICDCGFVKLWHGVAHSNQTSQHLTDWYTPSHIIHGLVFYFGLWLIARRWSIYLRGVIAVVLEVSWEVIENTPWIINRYRTVTVSLDYFGDSVINSTFDALAMVIGFILARALPVWASVAIVVGLELWTGYFIRDNLSLNIIMLLWPVQSILDWQASG